MVGSELNPTQGKRGGKLGDIGASSFPSASHPKSAQQALPGVFSRGFSLLFLVLCSETARKHLLRRLSHPSLFLLVNFSPALFNLKVWNNRLPWNLHLLAPGSVVSYLCQEPSDELLPLLVRLFVFTGFCHILRLGFFLLCVILLYVSHWNANKLFHFPRVKVLCPLFYIYNFSIISRNKSCDSVRPIKTFLHVNRDGSFFLCKNPFNFFGKFSNFQLFLSVLQSWADSMFSPSV